MLRLLQTLDRRWIFLLMGLAVAIPILYELQFPERPTGLARAVFDEVESLEEGDQVLLAFDFDPASEGELGPMATAFVRHCCEKKVKMYFMALWPVGPQMIDESINKVIKADFPGLVYGRDYVNLGFKSGNEGVIKVIVTDLKSLYTTDGRGTNIDHIPMCREVDSVQDFDLVINVSAGYAGTKEWVQYAATPYPDKIRIVAGCTGVQAPLLYPYIPKQLPGLLGAIKGAAEYEELVVNEYDRKRGNTPDPKYLEAKRRMGPQLIAHVLMIGLIAVGNIVFFLERKQEKEGAVKRGTLLWTVVLIAAGAYLAYRAGSGQMVHVYVQDVEGTETFASPADVAAGTATYSRSRTIGVWVAALFTLCIFSFLYRDNPFYKLAESVVVGVSAAYWMVVGFWGVIVPNLLGKLWPAWVQSWAMPGLSPVRERFWYLYLIPLLLGVMLLWRLSPKGSWIARWPLAFIIGTTAGIRLVGFIQADFFSQIDNTIVPLALMQDGSLRFWDSLRNIVLVGGVLCCLVYFFFSIEHKGFVGHVSRVGIWVLMITFGAAFGYTVMGRIALLAIRMEFLFDDWLWLIDPVGRRVGM